MMKRSALKVGYQVCLPFSIYKDKKRGELWEPVLVVEKGAFGLASPFKAWYSLKI